MISFCEIHLPEEFVSLLREQNFLHGENSANIAKVFMKYPSLNRLLTKSLSEFDQGNCRAEVIIQNLGWTSLRDRMASVFIKKQISGHYTYQTDLDFVQDTVDLEEKLIKHSILGSANSFLFSYYLKFLSIKYNVENFEIAKLEFYPKLEQSMKLLTHLQSRVVKIDWLMIQLMHFCEFIPYEIVEEQVKTGNYENLYKMLSTSQRKIMMNNLLCYGYAINDFETLVPPAEAV